MSKKLQEMMLNVMLPGKYQRMTFDISFEVIQNNSNNPSSFLLAPLANLLSYTSTLRCLQMTSSFACCALILRDQELFWNYD